MPMDMNTQMRLTGLATGLDTDQIIQNLGRVHTMRVDTVKREKQLAMWRQEAFRNVINSVSTFMRSNLDIINPMSNFRSPNAFARFTFNLSMKSAAGKALDAKAAAAGVLSVTANGDLKNYNQSVQGVAQLASKDEWSGKELQMRGVTSSGFSVDNFITTGADGYTITGSASAFFGLSIDGVSKTIRIDGAELGKLHNDFVKYKMDSDGPITNNNIQKLFETEGFLDRYIFVEGEVGEDGKKGEGKMMKVSEYLHTVADNLEAEAEEYKNVADAIRELADGTIDYEEFRGVDIAAHILLSNRLNGINTYTENNEFPGHDAVPPITREQAKAQAFADLVNAEIVKQFGKDYSNIVELKEIKGNFELAFHKPASNIVIFDSLGMADSLKNLGFPGGASSGDFRGKTIVELLNTGDFFPPSEWITDMEGNIGIADHVKNEVVFTRNDGSTFTKKLFGDDDDDDAVSSTTDWALKEGYKNNYNPDPTRTIQINGASIVVSANDTIETLTNKINNSTAGVNFAYNTAGDRFTLTSKTDGTAANISDVTDATAQFFEILGFGKAVAVDRIVLGLDGQETSRVGHKLVTGGDWELAENEAFLVVDKDGGIQGSIRWDDEGEDGPGYYHYYFEMDGDGKPTTEEPLARKVDKDEIAELLNLESTGSRSKATNLVAMINGEVFTRQSNTFQYEGMTYTFHSTFNVNTDENGYIIDNGKLSLIDPTDEIKIQVDKDTDDIINSIKNFVDEYNKILTEINDLISQRRDRDFRPLSDDEKKAMKEDEIKAYEEKAKQGILANDPDLRRLQDQLRSIIYTPVDGVSITMADIGITTSGNWKDGGLLVIDDSKLKTAIENNYDQVIKLFTSQSDIPYGDTANRNKRMSELGIAQRMHDVMQDAARTTVVNNSRGYLVEKAGVPNTATVTNNTIQKQIDSYDKRISTLLDRWYRQERTYYTMFARMETMMMKMQSQQSSLASIMANQGGGF